MKRLARCLIFAALALLPLASRAQQEKIPLSDLKTVEEKWPNAKKTSSGVRYVMHIEGTGDPIRRGDLVEVLYVGSTLDGREFDREDNPLRAMKFRVGRGEVIQGWEIGLQLMRKGSKMTLIVPPTLAYGTRGDLAHGIGRNAVLVFEVSVLSVTREEPAPQATSQTKATK